MGKLALAEPNRLFSKSECYDNITASSLFANDMPLFCASSLLVAVNLTVSFFVLRKIANVTILVSTCSLGVLLIPFCLLFLNLMKLTKTAKISLILVLSLSAYRGFAQ